MKSAAEDLTTELRITTFAEPEYPVLQNISAESYTTTNERMAALASQLYKPVLWVDTINKLENYYGAKTMIEFGPGKVLSGLNRRINREINSICISDPDSLDKSLAACAD
jgi:[acyl-carrier-protein] S-malonyltransferase